MCFNDNIFHIAILFLRLFKGVIDKIQQLNVAFHLPAYIAFTLHHCCCSNHLPPQMAGSFYTIATIENASLHS